MTGTCQFLGERLQAARDLGDLRGAILLRAGHLHQLQVIDDDQVQAVLALDAPRTRAQFGRRQRRGLIDEDLRLGQLAGGAGDAHPVIIGDLAAANAVERHVADRG
jgi:hypothetical protein